MQTYLEVQLPISKNARWISDLKNQLKGVPVRWQNGFYHITLAFLDDSPNKLDVSSVIDRHMKTAAIYNLCFDKLDAFTTNSSKMHIINLTATDIPEPFMNWVNGIRTDLEANGCLMQSGFRLHVTLGRVDSSAIKIDRLQGIIENFKMPSFVLPLRSFDYREFRGESIKRWEINDNQQ